VAPSPQICIRRATPDDWPTIVEYNSCLVQETEHKTLHRERLEQGVKAILGNPALGSYFVAVDGEELVGQIMTTYEWSDWRNGMIWWIQSVYVQPSHRRRGVFRSLYQHVADLARRDPGVVGLRLYVEQNNAPAQSAYNNLGMRPAGYLVLEQMFVE
jgi:ribosomal protein S18 acetylase RimI-like enzyme